MNPEFQRNLWLEASPRRLAWAGVVLALVYGATVFVQSQNQANSEPDVLGALGVVGEIVFLLAVLWGVRLAGQSIGTEVGERTWEFQRLSAVAPWGMSWGKLFGATSLAWLVALSGLLLSTIALAARQGLQSALLFAVTGVAVAVLLQSAGMAAALVGLRKARAEGRVATLRSAAGGVFSVIFVLAALSLISQVSSLWLTGLMTRSDATGGMAGFWGAEIPARLLMALSLVAFAAWALVGAWRLMRLELQMRNAPWVWVLFLLFTAWWATGMAWEQAAGDEDERATVLWAVAGVIFAAGAYAGAFAEPADRVRLHRFGSLARESRWREAAPLVPLALPAVLLAGVAAVGFTLNMFEEDEGVLMGLAVFAFLLRDLAVIAFFRFGPRPKRGDFGAVVALGLLYGLGAAVTSVLGDEARAIVFPHPEASLLSLISGLVQAAVIGNLALRRLRRPEESNVQA
jgi:hypothetical protein